MSEEKEQKKERRIGWLWSVTIIFLIVLLGSMAIIWFGSNDVAGWDGDSGEVSGECYEWTENTLSPKGYVNYNHQIHGFKYSSLYESFEYGSDGDSPCDDCNMYDWKCALSNGTGIISETRSTDGYRSVQITYATGNTAIYCDGLTATNDGPKDVNCWHIIHGGKTIEAVSFKQYRKYWVHFEDAIEKKDVVIAKMTLVFGKQKSFSAYHDILLKDRRPLMQK